MKRRGGGFAFHIFGHFGCYFRKLKSTELRQKK